MRARQEQYKHKMRYSTDPAKWIRIYRRNNPEYRFDKNREYQDVWRAANIELNRLRARNGMRQYNMAKRMYKEILQLLKDGK